MSNWTAITSDMIKAAGFGVIVDKARTIAVGSIDPVGQDIAGVTSDVRGAVAAGNTLDADATKIPNSQCALAIRLILCLLKSRIGFELSVDDSKQRDLDYKRLGEIRSNKERVEEPDTPAGNAEMQTTGLQMHAVNVPRRQTRRDQLSGL